MSNVVSENLARLLAMENLRVEHRKIPTAMFDLQNRILMLPIFKTEMSKDVYDLLVGHEIGHGLETPTEGWHNAVMVDSQNLKNKGRGFKSFLNVVEDARIERLVKSRYPGLRKTFHRGYKELFEKNFFGDFSKAPEKLLLVDRINLFYKVGALTMVTFSDEEQRFLKRIDAATSWDEVVKIATDLYNYCSDELQEQMEDQYEDELAKSEEGDENEDEEVDYEPCSGEMSPYEEVESLTDKAFREREAEFVDEMSLDVLYVNLPTVDPFEHIISYKTLMQKGIVFSGRSSPYIDELPAKLFKEFLDKNSKYVNFLAKEFELKKNAAQQVRARQHKTGVLDVNKLYRYKFDDEVFKAVTTVPGGKNHGLVMFVDWSGSMMINMASTIEQLLVLVHFCKKVNIPFEVFAFLSYHYENRVKECGDKETKMQQGDLVVGGNHFSVAQLLSSDMKRSEFSGMVKQLLVIKEMYTTGGRARGHYNMRMSLGNTPLNETILFARYFVEMYKKNKKLDIVNTVVLSDGEGANLPPRSFNNYYSPGSVRVIYVDPITKKQIASDVVSKYAGHEQASLAQLKAFVQLTKECTGSNMLGFYIVNNPRHVEKFFKETTEADKYSQAVRKDKFAVSQAAGFDEYYFIRDKNMEIENEELKVDAGVSRTKLLSAFKKNQSKKIMNRVILNRFISQIS